MYPKHQPDAGVPASPSLPSLEREVLDYWAGDRTFQASVDARDAGANGRERVRLLRRPAVRQRPAALRPPADRLRQGRRAALPDDARPPRRAPLRLGLPRPAGRDRGREGARHHAQGRDHRARHRQVQRRLPRARCCGTPSEWERLRHPPGALGRLRQRLQDAWTCPTWRASCGRSRRSRTRAWSTRASACSPYCWRCETPLSQLRDPARRRLPRPAGPGAHRRASSSRSDRRARAARCWTTTPWTLPSNLALAVGPDIDYARARDATASSYVARRRRALGAYAQGARRRRAGRHASRAATWSGARYTPLFDFFADTPNAFRVLGGDFVTTEDGTGVVHMAPAFGEDDQRVVRARPASRPSCPVDDARPVHRARSPPVPGHAASSTRTRRSSAT